MCACVWRVCVRCVCLMCVDVQFKSFNSMKGEGRVRPINHLIKEFRGKIRFSFCIFEDLWERDTVTLIHVFKLVRAPTTVFFTSLPALLACLPACLLACLPLPACPPTSLPTCYPFAFVPAFYTKIETFGTRTRNFQH